MVSTLLVHEWFELFGGAEKVVDEMWEVLEMPEVFCLWDSRKSPGKMKISESKLGLVSGLVPKPAMIPAMIPIWQNEAISKDFDQVVISSHLFAHHLAVDEAKTRKFVYVHSPARYLWAPEYDGRASGRLSKLVSPMLRDLDKRRSCSGATAIAANSRFIAERIYSSWGLASSVVYPNVDFNPIPESHLSDSELRDIASLPAGFALSISRLVSYKRIDLSIELSKNASIPLVIAGQGPFESQLKELATELGIRCWFLGRVSDAMLHALYRRASILIFPGVEDFGITPVEAMFFGVPVLANITGGTAETVEPGVGGFLSNFDDMDELKEMASLATTLDKEQISNSVLKFSRENFKTNFNDWLNSND